MNVNRTSATSPVITAAMTETRLQQDVTSTNPAILMFRELVRKEEPWYVQHNTTEKACFIKLVDTISTNTRPGDCINIADDFSLVVSKNSENDNLLIFCNGKQHQFDIRFTQLSPLLLIDQITHPEDYGLTVTEADFLAEIALQNADLNEFNLSKVQLKNTNLSNASLAGANLAEVTLTGVTLIDTNLTGTNLSGAKLIGVMLLNTNLTGANLTETHLTETHLRSANLTGADLTRTEIVLALPATWNDTTLNYYLNHNNNNGGSLLTAIDSIDNCYLPLKRQLLVQLIDSLARMENPGSLIPYMDYFSPFLKTDYIDQAGAEAADHANIAKISDFMQKSMIFAVATPAATAETRLQQDVTSTNPAILMFRELVRKEDQWYVQHNTNEKACFIKLVDTISADTRPGDCINIAADFSLVVSKNSENDNLILSCNGKQHQFNIRFSQLYLFLLIDQIAHPSDYNPATMDIDFLAEIALQGADLKNLYLSEIKLENISLTNTSLSGANLTGANLIKVMLADTNLTGANLTGARLTAVDMRSATLTGANLTGAEIELALPEESNWNDTTLDYYLNHNHNNGASLLMAIDSIDRCYLPLKRQLLVQLIDSLARMPNPARLIPYMNNFLPFLKTDYIDQAGAEAADHANIAKIHDFMQKNVILPIIQRANGVHWVSNNDVYPALLTWLQRPDNFEHVAIADNLFFTQLIVNSQDHPDSEVRKQARDLYNNYLKLERIQPYTEGELSNVFGDLHGKVDWEDKTANHIILVSKNDTLLLSQNQFNQMREPNENTVWSHLLHYQHPKEGDPIYTPINLNQDFAGFPLLRNNYLAAQRKTLLPNLLTLLNLGDYASLFMEESHRRQQPNTNQHKLIDPQEQGQLFASINPLLIYPPATNRGKADPNTRLNGAHLQAIEALYALNRDNNTEKAQVLFSLATLFASYSSSLHFGTEQDSPTALRLYAFALLHEARLLDTSKQVMTTEQFAEWRDKLLGLNNAFTCTAVVSEDMLHHGDNLFPEVIHSIYPQAWR